MLAPSWCIPNMLLRGIRTNLTTGITSKAYYPIETIRHGEDDWFHVVGGPTGYEDMPLDVLDDFIQLGGWVACAGAQHFLDRLFFPEIELRKLRENLRKVKPAK